MKYKRILSYLQTNLTGYQTFMFKPCSSSESKCQAAEKDRWGRQKAGKGRCRDVKKTMETLYNNLRRELKSDIASAWISYI